MKNNTKKKDENNALNNKNEEMFIHVRILSHIQHFYHFYSSIDLNNDKNTIKEIINKNFINKNIDEIDIDTKIFLELWLIWCKNLGLQYKEWTFDENNIKNLIKIISQKYLKNDFDNEIKEAKIIKDFIIFINIIRINILSTDNEELKIYFKKENTEQIKITQETSTDIQNILNQKGD